MTNGVNEGPTFENHDVLRTSPAPARYDLPLPVEHRRRHVVHRCLQFLQGARRTGPSRARRRLFVQAAPGPHLPRGPGWAAKPPAITFLAQSPRPVEVHLPLHDPATLLTSVGGVHTCLPLGPQICPQQRQKTYGPAKLPANSIRQRSSNISVLSGESIH